MIPTITLWTEFRTLLAFFGAVPHMAWCGACYRPPARVHTFRTQNASDMEQKAEVPIPLRRRGGWRRNRGNRLTCVCVCVNARTHHEVLPVLRTCPLTGIVTMAL